MSTLLDLRKITAHLGRHDPSEVRVIVADAYGDQYSTTNIHAEGTDLVITIEENVTPIVASQMPPEQDEHPEQTLFEAVGEPDPIDDLWKFTRPGGNRPDAPDEVTLVEVNRDAGTGRFVSDEYADQHPATTVTEKVERD